MAEIRAEELFYLGDWNHLPTWPSARLRHRIPVVDQRDDAAAVAHVGNGRNRRARNETGVFAGCHLGERRPGPEGTAVAQTGPGGPRPPGARPFVAPGPLGGRVVEPEAARSRQ